MLIERIVTMFVLILNQLMKMQFIMILAFICYRLHVIDQEGNKNFSNLLLMVVNPCLIITVFQTDYDKELVWALIAAFGAAVIAHIICFVTAHFLVPEKNNPDYALERFGAAYSNCGFMGIPLINSVLGGKGVFILTAYMTVFNLLTWTHGLLLLNGRFSAKRLKEGLLAPIVVCTVIGAVLFFLQFRIPSPLIDSMQYIADMNTPLAMMIAGFSVAQSDLKKMFFHVRTYWVCFMKLVIMPLAVLVFLAICPMDRTVAYTTLIAAACPTATTLTMMSIRFERNYTYASEIFSFSTVLSVATIPMIIYIADFVL